MHSDNESAASKNTDTKTRKKRKYLPSWKNTWSWLMYDPVLDVVKCQSCVQATDLKLLKTDKRTDDAFVSRGFKNWDKGPDRFAKHEASVNHHDSVTNLATITSVPSVDSKLNAQIGEGQKMAREALKVILRRLRCWRHRTLPYKDTRMIAAIFSNFLNFDVMIGHVLKRGLPNVTITLVTPFRTRYCRC